MEQIPEALQHVHIQNRGLNFTELVIPWAYRGLKFIAHTTRSLEMVLHITSSGYVHVMKTFINGINRATLNFETVYRFTHLVRIARQSAEIEV